MTKAVPFASYRVKGLLIGSNKLEGDSIVKTKAVVFFIMCAIFLMSATPIVFADEMIVSGDFEYYISPETAHEDYRGTVVITKYLGNDKEVVIPSEIDERRVSSIDYMAFYKNETLKSVQLPDTLVGIGVDAFAFCKSLESVNIPEGIKALSPAFRGCEKLESIVIPEGVIRIEQGMFRDCTALENVTLPNSLKIIDGSVFEKCISLKNISLPNGVVEIGVNAFGGCTALSEISISESVTYIGASAFGNTAFYNDAENWENDVLYVDGCLIDSKREKIQGEYSVKEGTRIIAEQAFLRATGLETLKLPKGLKVIGDAAFAECTALKTVEMQGGLETIGSTAFRKCVIDEIVIPEGVKSIGDRAFDRCGIVKVTLPKSLESIGNEAFGGTTDIKKVKYNGSNSEWNEKQFGTAMGLSPYALVEFAEGNNNEESVSDTLNSSDESVEVYEASKTTDDENDTEDKKDTITWIIPVAAIAILAITVLIIFLVKKRKKFRSAS